MIKVQSKLVIEISPSANDVCAVISAVSAYHQGKEEQYLASIQKAVTDRLAKIRADTSNGGDDKNSQ